MIFETDKFEFEMGRIGTIVATNGYRIIYRCKEDECTIKFGDHIDSMQSVVKSNEEAENFIVQLIKTHVKDKGEKIDSIHKGKVSNSQYLSIMETLI